MTKALKYLNLVFFILMVGLNVLANMLPIGHGNTGEISKKYENLFTPAPITFSIWGVIYLFLLIFILYQLGIFDNHTLSADIVRLIGPWFILTCIFNIGWLLSWHYDIIWLSMVIMICLLLSLIVLTNNISPVYIKHATNISSIPALTKMSMCTFDLYLGWIAAATIANASAFLVSLEWNQFGFSSQFWTVIMLLVGTLIGILFIVTNQRYIAAIAIIWAYCGIIIKHISQSGYGGKYPSIIAVAIIGIVVILSSAAIKLVICTTSYE